MRTLDFLLTKIMLICSNPPTDGRTGSTRAGSENTGFKRCCRVGEEPQNKENIHLFLQMLYQIKVQNSAADYVIPNQLTIRSNSKDERIAWPISSVSLEQLEQSQNENVDSVIVSLEPPSPMQELHTSKHPAAESNQPPWQRLHPNMQIAALKCKSDACRK